MDIDSLNTSFLTIVKKKEQLHKLNGNDIKYEFIKKEIESLEGDFMMEYGSFLEEAIFGVHDEYCPDNDILLPSAYMASTYFKKEEMNNTYDVSIGEGVKVEADDFPGVDTRLVLLPSPTRLVLQCENPEMKEILWVAV